MSKEKDYFLENLAILFGASINVLEALDALKAEAQSRKLRRVIDAIKEDINSGYPLSKALERARIFPGHAISLIRIGEESGRLSENLKVVAAERQKDREFKSKIRSAMAYPLIVLTLTLLIGVGVSWFILPRLASVFAELEVELPAITKMLIASGRFLGDYGALVVPLVLLGFTTLVYLVFFFPYTRFIGEKILFVFPGTKYFIREIEVARFGYMLGNLLNAGLPIVPALESVCSVATFRVYKQFYVFLKDSIEAGNSLTRSFKNYGRLDRLFPRTATQMILAAEKSGALPEILGRVGEIYSAKTEVTIKSASAILEPVLLIIVWFGVLAVAIAIILPIYSLIGGFNP